MAEATLPWPHAPTHQLCERGTYLVTAATYQKAHYFRGAERLRVLQRGLLKLAADYGWQIEAWVVFPNHYHFVAHSPAALPSAENLPKMLTKLHTKTATWLNRLDGSPGRQIWHNYWETRLTTQKAYFARLNYVHQNPVRHGVVPVASQYLWGSARWFERTASPAQVKCIYRFKTDTVQVEDDFEVAGGVDWGIGGEA